MSATPAELVIRRACDADLADVMVMVMVDDFVRGRPAAHHVRAADKVRVAYFGELPVARLFVAVRRGRVIGVLEWSPIFDLFWCKRGGKVEWLYVRPEARGQGSRSRWRPCATTSGPRAASTS